ncbi:AUGMIN subunit 2-like [Rutidosis leptorrhynchoides]|uniref:AUGMIN subunit 2-like n=1 Tax=Rutidosis leptorrhynchoides TaxID=125765 RepID=UPI003A9A634D
MKEDLQNGDELVKVLRELIVVKRKVANLHVALQGRKKEFSELLMHAASDYGTLAASDLIFTGLTTLRNRLLYGQYEMLRPISVALVSCTRYYEAMSAMRESFTNLQKAWLIPSRSLSKDPSRRISPSGSECVTPHSSGHVSSSDDLDPPSPKIEGDEKQEREDETNSEVEN